MTSEDGSIELDAAEGAVGNLPHQLTRLIDRKEALAELASLIWRTRVLTLTGPGGAGKTRLAVALAEAVRADFVGGAWWVDLSNTMDAASVPQTVAMTLFPEDAAADPTPYGIARRFADSSLLVLDNCEQVVDACGELVADLLGRAQSLRIIATSRQPLGVPGERRFGVAGLDIEASEETSSRPGGPQAAAIELFIERAQEASSSFDPSGPGVREAIERICAWLDGMPLAIELAAARVPILGVAQIAERLELDAGFLRQRSRGAPQRHRTLQDMLEWSHRMLEPSEQRLFSRLSSFRGGFSLAAAEAVCADAQLPAGEVLDVLSVLVEHSLVQVVDDGKAPRYRLLATVRQYAAEKLVEGGEDGLIAERHARFFYGRAEEAQRGLSGPDEVRWLQQLELDHDNLIDALEWYSANDPAKVVSLAARLWPFWYQRGYYQVARSWFERSLAAGSQAPADAITDMLVKTGEVAFLQCDYEIAAEHLRRALNRERADQRTVATALQRLGSIERERGRYAESRKLHERSLVIWRELGDARGAAASQSYLGFAAWLAGDPLAAESLCSEALAEFAQSGLMQDSAVTLVSLGAAALHRGELELAAERLERALAISRRLGFQEGIAWSLHELAIIARRRRQPVREQALMLRDALLLHRQLGDRWRVASVLEELAGSLLARQDPRQAVEVFAAADALRERLGAPVPPAELPDREVALARCRRRLSSVAFRAALAEGRARDLDHSIELVTSALDRLIGAGDDIRDRHTAPILTPRELAVLELLSEGQTNREIAAALYMSPSTAGVHVSNILRKLGAKRRVDATGRAHTLGLLPAG